MRQQCTHLVPLSRRLNPFKVILYFATVFCGGLPVSGAHPLTAKRSKLSKQIDDARSARSGGPARVGPSRARGMHHMHFSSSIEECFALRAVFSFGHTIYYKACK